ncbi:Uncharacterised protein g5882 [Pycnogonum litorale]
MQELSYKVNNTVLNFQNYHQVSLSSMAVHFVEFVTFSLILMSSPRFGHANFNMNLPQSVIDFMNSGEANVWNFISGMMEYTQSKTIIIIIDTYSIGTIRKPLKSLLNPKTHQGIYFRSTVLHQDSAHLLQDPEIEHSLVLFLCSYRTVVNTMKWIMSSSEMLYKLSWITINNNKEWNTFELPEISPALKFFVVKFHYVKEHAEASAKVNRYEVTYLYNDFYMDRQRSSKIGDWSKATGLKTRKRFSDCCFNVSGYFVRVAFVSVNFNYYVVFMFVIKCLPDKIMNVSFIHEMLNLLDLSHLCSSVNISQYIRMFYGFSVNIVL